MTVLLRCGRHTLDLSTPAVMGILNVTPDSFSDGGRHAQPVQAVQHALSMARAGARIIDVGGESTRPGAQPVSAAEEMARVIPVIQALAQHETLQHTVISIDTSKAEVMHAAIRAGATLVNDVRALREDDALQPVAGSDVAVCLMHMRGEPRTMQMQPHYDDVVGEVLDFLQSRIQQCLAAGVQRERIVIDPGIGFGKTLQHNLALLAAVPRLGALGVPVLIGISRKSMFKTLLDRPVEQRLAGALAVTSAAVLAGAAIVRTHDVAETVDAVRTAAALRDAGYRSALGNH
jgi:dihydropteroate synthase